MSSDDVQVIYCDAHPPEKSPNYKGFHPGVIELPAGHKKNDQSRPLDKPMILERDQSLQLRDGTTIYADIYRPTEGEPVPAIVAWGPYGKSGSGIINLASFPQRVGIALSRLSGYENFEGPDPAEWIPRGYAVVNIDARGVMDSEGDIRFWGKGDGEDGYDAIEQIAVLPWCNSKVTLAGNSWLAISQWFIAAERPPHLACIAPLEGVSDFLREQFYRGGVPEKQFWFALTEGICGRNRIEDIKAMQEKYPLTSSYWEDKRANMKQIQVPAYILASYSTGLHILGSFRGYEEIPHNEKWLTIHGTQEWYDLYTPERIEELHTFFDRYTKGIENGWEATPRIRGALLTFNGPAQTGIEFSEPFWNYEKNPRKRLYVNGNKTLSEQSPSTKGSLTYDADAAPVAQLDADPGELQFSFKFDKETSLIGPSRAVLYLSTSTKGDFDVYVQLRKADGSGRLLQNLNIPFDDLNVSSVDDIPLISPTKYLGPSGILRASNREIDEELSKPHWKTLSHKQISPVSSGDPVRVEIEIWPTGIQFEAGEQLVLKVSGHFMGPAEFVSLHGTFPVANRGQHTLWWGSGYESYVEVPIQDISS